MLFEEFLNWKQAFTWLKVSHCSPKIRKGEKKMKRKKTGTKWKA